MCCPSSGPPRTMASLRCAGPKTGLGSLPSLLTAKTRSRRWTIGDRPLRTTRQVRERSPAAWTVYRPGRCSRERSAAAAWRQGAADPGAAFKRPRSTVWPCPVTRKRWPASRCAPATTATFGSDGALGPPVRITPGAAAAAAGAPAARPRATAASARRRGMGAILMPHLRAEQQTQRLRVGLVGLGDAPARLRGGVVEVLHGPARVVGVLQDQGARRVGQAEHVTALDGDVGREGVRAGVLGGLDGARADELQAAVPDRPEDPQADRAAAARRVDRPPGQPARMTDDVA